MLAILLLMSACGGDAGPSEPTNELPRLDEVSLEPPRVDPASIADEKIVELIASSVADVESSPRDATAWRKLGEVYQAHGLYQVALDSYDVALALGDVDPELRYLRAVTFYNLSRIDDAIAEMRAVTELAPDYLPARWRLGYFHLEQADAEQAGKVFAGVIAEDPDSVAALIGAARAMMEVDQPEQAVAVLERARGLDPANAAYVDFLLGTAYQRSGQREKAELALRTASSEGLQLRDPWLDRLQLRRPGYFQNLESVMRLLEQNKPDSAIMVLDNMMVKYADDESVVGNLGYAYLLKGDWDQSIAYTQRALEIVPDWIFGLRNLALAYSAKARSLEGAERERYAALGTETIDRALALHPGSAALLAVKADYLELTGDVEAAREMYAQAFGGIEETERRANIDWLYEAARLEGLQENWPAALEIMERALTIAPDDAEAHARIAVAQFNLGDEAAARTAALESAALVRPDQRSTIADLQRLGQELEIDWAAEGIDLPTGDGAGP